MQERGGIRSNMSELYMMMTITNRSMYRKFQNFYQEEGLTISFGTVGRGTAGNETLNLLGLESSEKALIWSFVAKSVWKKIKMGLQTKMRIDLPGMGVAFIIPLSSIGGKRALQFLTENQNFEKEEESILKDTRYELLIAISNQGYTEMVMDAARSAGASGGTVIHAKGTGMERAEHFLGVVLVAEKDVVLIVVKKEQKNDIMQAIMRDAGVKSKAGTIVFSLPVTSTAGMRLIEDAKEE